MPAQEKKSFIYDIKYRTQNVNHSQNPGDELIELERNVSCLQGRLKTSKTFNLGLYQSPHFVQSQRKTMTKLAKGSELLTLC